MISCLSDGLMVLRSEVALTTYSTHVVSGSETDLFVNMVRY